MTMFTIFHYELILNTTPFPRKVDNILNSLKKINVVYYFRCNVILENDLLVWTRTFLGFFWPPLGILAPCPGTELMSPAMEMWGLNHQTPREVNCWRRKIHKSVEILGPDSFSTFSFFNLLVMLKHLGGASGQKKMSLITKWWLFSRDYTKWDLFYRVAQPEGTWGNKYL